MKGNNIAALSVANAHIAGGAVDGPKIATAAVDWGELASSGVRTVAVQDIAVTWAKLFGGIPESKLGAISASKIDFGSAGGTLGAFIGKVAIYNGVSSIGYVPVYF